MIAAVKADASNMVRLPYDMDTGRRSDAFI